MKELANARARMLLTHPFFAYLVLGLEEKFDEHLPAVAATDGKYLYIKPSGFKALTTAEQTGVLAHEAYHLAFGHPARRGNRTAMAVTPSGPISLWSIACDYAVNQSVDKDGLTLPAGVLRDPKYEGKTSEQVYEDLLSHAKKQPNPGGMCCDRGWGEKEADGTPRYQEQEWADKIASAAEAARMQGKLPAGVESLIENLTHPKLDWRTMLREFIQASVPFDYRRSPPNKHHLHRGLVLPSMKGEQLVGGIVFDTSGSMSDDTMRDCLSEALGIIQQYDDYKLHLWQVDAAVQEYRELTPFDGALPTKIRGRGGTSFIPAFEDVQARHLDLPFLIYFTDGYGDFPQKAPPYPVLWVIVNGNKEQVPFGQQVAL